MSDLMWQAVYHAHISCSYSASLECVHVPRMYGSSRFPGWRAQEDKGADGAYFNQSCTNHERAEGEGLPEV